MRAIIKAMIAGSVIIGIGFILFMIALALNGWKFMPKFEMAQFTAEGEVGELKIENSVGNIKTEFYDGEKVVVDYPDSDRYSMAIEEKDGALIVNGLSKKHWYSFTLLPSALPVTTVKIPKDNILKLSVTVNAGSVELANGEYADTAVTVNAGSLNILGLTCPAFKGEVNAGAISVKELNSASVDCKVKAGAFYAEKVTCPAIHVSVSAGSANFAVQSRKEEYTIEVSKSAGSCNVSNQTGTDPAKKITASISAGSIGISFV